MSNDEQIKAWALQVRQVARQMMESRRLLEHAMDEPARQVARQINEMQRIRDQLATSSLRSVDPLWRSQFIREKRHEMDVLRGKAHRAVLQTLISAFEAKPITRPARFPAAWELLAYLVPSSIRRKVYGPIHAELLADYVRTRQYKGKRARSWIAACFLLRTVVAIIGCLLVWAKDPAVRLLIGSLPVAMRHWWFRAGTGGDG